MPAQVLIVDDDQAIRETVRFVLEDVGHSVLEASDGEAALEILRQSAGGMVVLLDLIMPGMNGEAMLSIVANDAALTERHTYIVMTAAQRQLTPTIKEVIKRISAPILQKPFDIDQLIAQVHDAAQRFADA